MENFKNSKEDFLLELNASIKELNELIKSFNSFEEQMQQPKIMLNLMMKTENYDETTHETVRNCFDEFNKLKKFISKIELKKDKTRKKLDYALFKKFYVDPHDFHAKLIELNDNISSYKEKVNAQIIRCIDYLNQHDVEIVL